MKATILRVSICLFFFGFSFYSYLDKQNNCTELRMRLPKVVKEIERIREENNSFQYQIECFENPEHLLSISGRSEFSHLKYPFTQDVLTVQEGLALQSESSEEDAAKSGKAKVPIAIGAK